eukprot:SAG31_NODE_8941_length_1359_cov_2.057143_2_plen_227_part_00
MDFFVSLPMSKVFSRIYAAVAVRLNNLENIRQPTAYEDALIYKNFLFQFVNNYFALFFIAFLKEGEIWGRQSNCKGQTVSCDEPTIAFNETSCIVTLTGEKMELGTILPCKGICINNEIEINSCMAELQTQLLVVFAVKQFAFQLLEVGLPFLKAQKDVAAKAVKAKLSGETESNSVCGYVHTEQDMRTKEEYHAIDYDGVFMDYNELAIQFGWVLPCAFILLVHD